LSRDVVFKESIFPFKSWISKYVNVNPPSTPSHYVFPPQSYIPDHSSKFPLASAEFSPPISFFDMDVPPDDFPDLVHPNDVSNLADSPNLIKPTAVSTQLDSIGLIPPAPQICDVVPIRQFSRPHKPPTYLKDYHYNLVVAPMLASAAFSQSNDSFAPDSSILYPLSSTLSYTKLSFS